MKSFLTQSIAITETTSKQLGLENPIPTRSISFRCSPSDGLSSPTLIPSQKHNHQFAQPSTSRSSPPRNTYRSRAMPAHHVSRNKNGLAMVREAQNPQTTTSVPTDSRFPIPPGAAERPVRKRRRSSGLSAVQPENASRAINLHEAPPIETRPRVETFVPISSEINSERRVSRGSWSRRRLLQEVREAVSFLSASGEKFAIGVIVRRDLRQSFVSESAVSFLGFRPMNLPVPRRPLLSISSGQIRPERYVRAVVEQVEISNGGRVRLQTGDMLVVDDRQFPPGVHAILCGNFFHRDEAGHSSSIAANQSTYSQRQPHRTSYQNSAQSSTARSEFTSDSSLFTVPTLINNLVFDDDAGIPPNYAPYNGHHQQTGIPTLIHPNAGQGYMTAAIPPLNTGQFMQPPLWNQNMVMDNFPPLGNQNFKMPGPAPPPNGAYGPDGGQHGQH